GITIMQMDEGLDTGDMLLKTSTPIHASDTGGSLHDRLADIGGKAIVEALVQLANGKLTPEPQNDAEANYAHKLSKEEGHIDWSRSAQEIERLIRAFNPWPGTFTDLGEQRIRIHQDRKSTRLNSSHVKISYAVFCLKKKKNIQTNKCIQRHDIM